MDPDTCPPAFTRWRRDVFRDSLVGAYADAAEVYDPERGFNDLLHGLIVYHLAGHRLRRAFEEDAEVQFESRGRGPELRIEHLRVRWNKVGRSSDDHIATSFPRGSLAAAAMAEGNHQLLLWGDEPGDANPVNWVLAHFGNPRDGLIRIYLAAPISTDGRDVTAWSQWISIYDAAQPLVDFPDAPAPGLPEAVEVGPIEISLLDDAAMGAISTTGESGRE